MITGSKEMHVSVGKKSEGSREIVIVIEAWSRKTHTHTQKKKLGREQEIV